MLCRVLRQEEGLELLSTEAMLLLKEEEREGLGTMALAKDRERRHTTAFRSIFAALPKGCRQ